jgi:hypothetical protein
MKTLVRKVCTTLVVMGSGRKKDVIEATYVRIKFVAIVFPVFPNVPPAGTVQVV